MRPCRSCTLREDHGFVLYSERMDKMWMMSSAEFIVESAQNKTGKNAGMRSIWFAHSSASLCAASTSKM
jgi:hypothetical protein